MVRKHYKVCFSISVHERMNIILQQINNIKKYNSDCIIILHVSSNMPDYVHINIDDVIVNPIRHPTKWGGILHTIISNFLLAEQICYFDYFVIEASNSLFFQKDSYEYMKQYSCGFDTTPLLKMWPQPTLLHEDVSTISFLNMLRKDIPDMIHSHTEGTFYNYNVIKHIMSLIM